MYILYKIFTCISNKDGQLVHDAFTRGDFVVVQKQGQYGFSQLAYDQVIERTLNRDSKTKGGTIGITMNKNAVSRWILSHHERAGIAGSCEEMAGRRSNMRTKKDLDKARTKRDEDRVIVIISTASSMTDPFIL